MIMFLKTLALKIIHVGLCSSFILLEFLINVWVYLKHKFVDFCHADSATNDYDYVFENAQRIDKVPTHLTVLLGNEKPSYKDLANLVVWSIASGIPFISFYDRRGILAKTEIQFQEAIEKRKAGDTYVIWHSSGNSYKNGFIGRKIHIRTLSVSDSQQSVKDVIKQFSSTKSEKIDQETVDVSLRNSYVFPDPDLGLYCGKTFNLNGYPPWQVRITEFLCLGTHYSIRPHQFLKALYRYSKTEQRLGK